MNTLPEIITKNLCVYDLRSDMYDDLFSCNGDDMPKPRNDCFCDNCFYGRDKLAIYAIDLIEQIREAINH